jgi:FAD/FMN-containing dehydrogenase
MLLYRYMQIPNYTGEIQEDAKTLDTYSRDASVFRIIPSGVLVPKSIDDVLALVAYARGERARGNTSVSLTARAAGTCMSGGPLTESLVISFAQYLNQIHEVGSDFVSVEPGAFYRDVETATLAKNLVFPSYPASKALCAMGGILNNNSGGEKTLKYGKTVDYVREVDMVCSDGNLYTFKEFSGDELKNILENDTTFFGDVHRAIYNLIQENKAEVLAAKPSVTKNSAGYYLWDAWNEEMQSLNLGKLICGAQGTLGITTRMTLGLVPVAPFVRTIVLFARTVSDLPLITSALLPHQPESLEMYDDHTFKIAMKFLPDIAKRMGGSMLSLGIQFIPEFLMALRGGIPKVVIIAEFTGNSQAEVDAAVEKAYGDVTLLTQKHSSIVARNIKTVAEASKYWTFRRESFNLLRSKLHGMRTAPFIEDVVIHANDFPRFMPEFEALLDEYKLIYTIVGHVGDGNLHVIPLMTLKEDSNIVAIKELSEKVYALIAKYKGSITGEHNDGLIRTPFLHYMFSDKVLGLFTQVKQIFDPQGIFNPHKKVNVTWEEAVAKIDRTI